MRFNIISTIFKKEIKEILRDKKMIYLIILMPFFLYPIMLSVMGNIQVSQQEKMSAQKIALWMPLQSKGSPVFQLLSKDSSLTIELRDFEAEDLKGTKKTMGIIVAPTYQQQLDAGLSTAVQLLWDQSQDALNFRSRSIKAQLDILNKQYTFDRLAQKELSSEFIQPFAVESIDLSPQEGGNHLLTSIIPIMIFFFIVLGCFQIAIDITAGEKERNTLQTLYTSTATAKEIIGGKFFALVSVGLTSATMNLVSLLLAMKLQAYILGKADAGTVALSLSPLAIVWVVILIFLATLFIGAFVMAIVLLANTYKEAQSYSAPIMMVVLMPAMMAFMPGLELNMDTVLIPMLNTTLALISLLKGSFDLTMILIVTAVNILYGGLALYLASLTFGNENVITGEKVKLKDLFSK